MIAVYNLRWGLYRWAVVKNLPATPAFLLRKFHGQRSLVGYSPWGCKESDVIVLRTNKYDQRLQEFKQELNVK